MCLGLDYLDMACDQFKEFDNEAKQAFRMIGYGACHRSHRANRIIRNLQVYLRDDSCRTICKHFHKA